MPQDPYVRYTFTMRYGEARRRAQDYFREFPKDLYETVVEHHENLGQGQNFRVIMKRLREPKAPC